MVDNQNLLSSVSSVMTIIAAAQTASQDMMFISFNSLFENGHGSTCL